MLFATCYATAYARESLLRYIEVLRYVLEGYLCNGAVASHLDVLQIACVSVAHAGECATLLEGV